ncbi:aminopeptidase P family protein [Clostridium fallax]|uniref:Xaa-Pro aminopeptidase n=1 Tax=Clostridium fallax TaxID=1533 RepID=A0A1M4T594_9CLOT|nr:aminopeptidase P family protein [Clostridium fallax]SHE39702.1 Xaa-Pro aminopeptidase [Clostridium fallax]SQB22606.1 peptidase, M24 family protein [Clostridium fallax]
MNINERISKLRDLMKEKGLDAFIIPSSDNHLSEYVGNYFKCREWISGFTGSAGTVVITDKEAHLWVDGRYHIQADKQTKGTEYIVEKWGVPGVDNFSCWISKNLKKDDIVGFNGKVISYKTFEELKEKFEAKGIKIKVQDDLIDKIWKDRPSMPCSKLFIHDVKYSGKAAKEKIQEVRERLKEEGLTDYLLASLDDIAWLLNLRGDDVPHNPVFLSYLLMSMDNCTLYIDKRKIDDTIINYLKENGVDVKDYDDIKNDLETLNKDGKITFDGAKTNVWLEESIPDGLKIKDRRNITTELKAIKNKVELENLENCQVKDGVAMVKFIYWLTSNIGKIPMDELLVSDKLEEIRRSMDKNLGISFDSISAYGANAAMMHYKATEENKTNLEPRSFYLIDSGGQYLDGTTDITRTIVLGDLTEEEKMDFTSVLKGNIDLSLAVFLYGTTGSNLDVLARKPIWERGLDYRCGTGHGVGFLLNVHEGPQSFSMIPNTVKLEEGMVITNEPGIYKEGRHGIRTENMLVVRKHNETEFGTFLEFEPITYCPIDLRGIKVNMLTDEEKNWLNEYHSIVYKKLSSHLDGQELDWLKEATRGI